VEVGRRRRHAAGLGQHVRSSGGRQQTRRRLAAAAARDERLQLVDTRVLVVVDPPTRASRDNNGSFSEA